MPESDLQKSVKRLEERMSSLEKRVMTLEFACQPRTNSVLRSKRPVIDKHTRKKMAIV